MNSDTNQNTINARKIGIVRAVVGRGIRFMKNPESYTSTFAIVPMQIQSPVPITLNPGENGSATSLYIKGAPYEGSNVTFSGQPLSLKVEGGPAVIEQLEVANLTVTGQVSLPNAGELTGNHLTLSEWAVIGQRATVPKIYGNGTLSLYGPSHLTAGLDPQLAVENTKVTASVPLVLPESNPLDSVNSAATKQFVTSSIASTAALYVPLTGATLSGKLIVPATVALDPANTVVDKSYLASQLNSTLATIANGYLPLTGGEVNGKVTSNTTIDSDSSGTLTTKGYVDTQRDKCVFKTGGTMTGPLLVPSVTVGNDPKTAVNLEYITAVLGSPNGSIDMLDARYVLQNGSTPIFGKQQSFETEAGDAATVMTTKGYVDAAVNGRLTQSAADNRYVRSDVLVSQLISGKVETPATLGTDSVYTLVTRGFLVSSISTSESTAASTYVPLAGEVTMTGRLAVPLTVSGDPTTTATSKSYVDSLRPTFTTITPVASTTWALDYTKMAIVTLNANVALTVSNATEGARYDLIVVQDGTGGRTITWNATKFKWAGGVAPVLSTVGGSIDRFHFVCYDGYLLGVGHRGFA